ncbi:hypothetical protein HDU87_002435 [Geranomyces variabilis]|uniref:STI1/HOP DP domain-containing protein n=1 Tax=Geranomyces variabilis TaxID=109894 RepID=A0AAD5TMR9_9FUNG|nr:hypothetical protein HDU87_002435 [Geranomyces variabilis]
MTDVSDDDLPPPLEDMSAVLNRYQKPPAAKKLASNVKTDKSLLDPPTALPAPAAKQAFGFKKGFLNEGSTTKTGAKPRKQTPIPLIKPNAKPEDGLRLSEVQDAMRGQMSLLDRQEWLTTDFLEKIERSPSLVSALADPVFQRAAGEMAKNPQAAFKKYARERPDIMEALREFAGMLGEKLGSMEGGATVSETNTGG